MSPVFHGGSYAVILYCPGWEKRVLASLRWLCLRGVPFALVFTLANISSQSSGTIFYFSFLAKRVHYF